VVFFFQAEDGIRDFHVTGVQTCALPISCELSSMPGYDTLLAPVARQLREAGCGVVVAARDVAIARQEFGEQFGIVAAPTKVRQRSEERRVGKECRWRRAPARGRESRGLE